MKTFIMNSHERPIRMVKFNFDGDLFYSSSDDGKICVWRSENASLLGITSKGQEVSESIKGFDVSRDSKLILAAQTTGGIKIYNGYDGSIKTIIMKQGWEKVRFCEFSLGDKEFVAVIDIQTLDENIKSEICIFNTENAIKEENNAECKKIIVGKEIVQASFSDMNKSLYIAYKEGMMKIYDLIEKNRITVEKNITKGDLISFSFSRDKIFLFVCSKDNNCYMVDPINLDIIKKFSNGNFFCRCVDISPLYLEKSYPCRRFHILVGGGQDAKDVATTKISAGGFDIKIINYITEEYLAEIRGHTGPVHSLAISPDGKMAISGSEDGTLRLYQFHNDYFTEKFD